MTNDEGGRTLPRFRPSCFFHLVRSAAEEEFDQVEITYEMGEPETVEQDGMVMIVQNERSIVHIKDEQMKNIIRKTAEVRNQLIAK